MANGAQRRRRASQKGVQAIFTSDKGWKGKAQFIAGLIGLATGFALWVGPFQSIAGFRGDGLQLATTLPPILLVPVSLVLIVVGVGVCTYLLVLGKTRREYSRIESAIERLEALMAAKEGIASSPSPTVADGGLQGRPAKVGGFSKGLVIALAEGLLIVVLFSGLVAEYRSNVHMQEWVRANVGFGAYFLSELMVLVLAATVLGSLIFHIAKRRILVVRPRNRLD